MAWAEQINALRRLREQGITPEDLAYTDIEEHRPDGYGAPQYPPIDYGQMQQIPDRPMNALRAAAQVSDFAEPPQQMPRTALEDTRRFKSANYNPETDAASPLPINSMRDSQTGEIRSLNFTGQPAGGGFDWASVNPAWGQQSQQPRTLKVFGVGNDGINSQLGAEDVTGPIQLDRSRPGIDIPGVGKAIYGKDGNAYVLDANGQPTAKAILGYDRQASMARNQFEQNRRKTEGDIAHTQEQIRASQVTNPDLGAVNPMGSGAAALEGVDPGTAALVKAYAEGKMAFPTGAAMRSPRMMQLLNLVAQYDPSFDAADYQARNKTLSGFTAGKQGDAIRAVNQAVAHAGSLQESIDKLDNFNGIGTPLNAPVNTIEQMFGDTRQGAFKQNAVALASELRKVFAGSGGGSLSELQSWESGLPLNASKEQQTAYLRKGIELLNGAVGALNDQYQRGMGPRANVMDIISPKAKETLAKLSGEALASPQSGGARRVQNAADYATLPSGATYVGPDGKTRRKS
jgi:hypothetical protein